LNNTTNLETAAAVPRAPRADADWKPQLHVIDQQTGSTVQLSGAWNLRSLEPFRRRLEAQLRRCRRDLAWDLTSVDVMDHAGALLLWRGWGGHMPEQVELRPEQQMLFDHLKLADPSQLPRRRRQFSGPLIVLGRNMLSFVDHVGAALVLLGRASFDALHLVRHPAEIPWREISASLYRTGAQALGITAVVGFLVGIVLSYLTAQQLRGFGADIYIVNLLGIAIIRELGPVLAAILVAGRSGSAMTAQIGVMRVTQELDALAVMGIPHTMRLVLPKMVALAIAMPLLILWTNAVALTGGMVSAQLQVGLDYRHFISSLPSAVPIANLWLGLGKGIVFGILIALIACHFGLRIKPNTESLGIGTTNSVVTAITVVIVVDAVFAIMFSDVGIFS
jgi:phospholipid/cholesterol/gamma-HCH transport system permease protein